MKDAELIYKLYDGKHSCFFDYGKPANNPKGGGNVMYRGNVLVLSDPVRANTKGTSSAPPPRDDSQPDDDQGGGNSDGKKKRKKKKRRRDREN